MSLCQTPFGAFLCFAAPTFWLEGFGVLKYMVLQVAPLVFMAGVLNSHLERPHMLTLLHLSIPAL